MNTMEVDDDQNLNNGPLLIHFQPGKLADFAEVQFAAALLRNKITYMRRNGGRGFRTHALDLVEISIPNGIREKIHGLIDNMEKNWTKWWFHHLHVFFIHSIPPADDMIDWIDQIVWSDDGTINYEQTAKNMLDGDELTNSLKYQLACAFCIIDAVEPLKQILTQEEIRFGGNLYEGFLNYWAYKYGVVQFNNVQLLNNIILSLQDEISLGATIYDEWPTIEYCFNQMNDVERVRIAVLLVHLAIPRLTLYILPKLTSSELEIVIKRSNFLIMKALVENRNYIEYTKLIWKRMVLIIDDLPLSNIVHYLNNLKYERSYVNPLLWEIWRCLSENQKKYIINQKTCNFVESELNMDYNYYFSPNFPLILDFLSHCDLERKFKYWSDHWPYLVVGQLDSEKRGIIDRIMKLCIVDGQKIEDFKKNVMINYNCIANYCEWLIYNGRIKEVQTYLEFCTSDSQLIRDLKKKIMMKMSKQDIMEFLLQWATDAMKMDFHQYLDEVFAENELKLFLNEIITDPGSTEEMCYAVQSPNRLQDVIEIVEKFVSSEESLVKVKNDLFEQSRLDTEIEKSVILDLIVWCFGASKHVVEKFKEIPSIDEESEHLPGRGDPIYNIFAKYYQLR